MNKQKVILLALGIGIGLIIGGATGYIIGHSADKAPISPPRETGTVTLEGKVICLLHKGDGLHTLECAAGLKTDDGKSYGIDENSNGTTLTRAAGSDKKVRVTGSIKPAADDDIYQTSGTLEVSSYEFIK